MIHEALAVFSNAQAVTVSAASTDHIDFDEFRQMGVGKDLSVVIGTVVAADVANADETYKAALETATDTVFTTPIEVAARTFTTAQAAIDLLAGQFFTLGLPQDDSVLQFLRAFYTTTGTTPSWTVDAFLTETSAVDAFFAFPSGFAVL